MNTVVSVLLLIVSSSLYISSDRVIALYILRHLNEINDLTASGICENTYVSPQSVKRFCRQLGYRNFQEFRRFLSYTKEIRKGQMVAHFMNMSEEGILKRIESFVPDMDMETFKDRVEQINRRIYASDHVVILGSVYLQMLAMHYAEDMLMNGKAVWAEPISQEIQTQCEEGTLLLVISLTGRVYQFYPEFFMKRVESQSDLVGIGNDGTIPEFARPSCALTIPVINDDETENSLIPLILQYMKYRYALVYGGGHGNS